MINFRYIYAICYLSICSVPINAQSIALEQWMQLSHPFSNQNLQSSEHYIWWNGSQAYFKYNVNTQDLEKFDQSNLLSDPEIQHFQIIPELKSIIVIYNSGRIDIIRENKVQSIYDWETQLQYPDKKVQHINLKHDRAYITTNNYLFILNLKEGVFESTIPIQEGLASYLLNDTLVINTPYQLSFYKNGWIKNQPTPLKYSQIYQNQIFAFDSTMIVWMNENLLDTLYIPNEPTEIKPKIIGEHLYFFTQDHSTQCIYQYNSENNQLEKILQWNTQASIVDITKHGDNWYGISENGLYQLAPQKNLLAFDYPQKYPVSNISSNNQYVFVNDSNKVWKVSMLNEWNLVYNQPTLQVFSINAEETYLVRNDQLIQLTSSSFKTIQYPFTDSIITSFYHSLNGLAILTDHPNQNLWIYSNSAWKSYQIPIDIWDNIRKIYLDDSNRLWMSIDGQGLCVYQLNSTNGDAHLIKTFQTNLNNIHHNKVLNMYFDNGGILWIGTADGIAYLPCSNNVQDLLNCNFVTPIGSSNNAGFRILAGEFINDMMTDAANRKWVATNNGLFMLNPSGDVILKHYTQSNSQLIHNKITSLSYISNKGLIVLNTAAGISVLKQEAESLNGNEINIQVYPNPGSKSLHNYVAIRQIPENATIKILSIGGQLIRTIHANGSQALWYFNNDKIQSGVYIAWIHDERKNKYYQTRIIITP